MTHGTLLNVLGRAHEDGCRAMQSLIRRSHDTPKEKKAHFSRAWQLFRALVERKIVEFTPRDAEGVHLRLNVGLQQDFSMNQTLSLYVHDTLPLMDPQAPDYALVVLTLVESILEDPDLILRRQLDQLKTQAVAEMKLDGLDYNQRMEELEKLEYPKPNREFIYSTFNAFAERHPWVGQENIRPKSIAREMFEEFRSFADYIKIYELQRAEGLLLRHLSGVHKVLTQTVPDAAKNDAVREMELYLGAMIRQVDSSLLEEWERMNDPELPPARRRRRRRCARPAGRKRRGTSRATRRRSRRWCARGSSRSCARWRAATARRALGGGAARRRTPEDAWTPERLRAALDAYPRRAPPHPPGPDRAQPAAHVRHPGRGQSTLARAADARRSRRGERLGGGVRRGPRALARTR